MPTTTPTALLEDLGWLRQLARQLTRDPHQADDLVQSTCTIALVTEAPRHRRGWLATVMRSLLHGEHRSARRRDRRHAERAAHAAGANMPDAATLVQRTEAQQRLTHTVLSLAEPYRGTVLLRFFEGLPPRHIATRCGVPVATVHSRLQRALQLLRAELDREFGSRATWQVAFVPLATPPLLPTTVTLLLMNSKLKLLAAVTAVIACSAPFWWPSTAASTSPVATAIDPAARRSGGDGDGTDDGGARSRARNAPERLAASPDRPAPAAPPQWTVRGRVCDATGRALAGVPIGPVDAKDLTAPSDAGGVFTLSLPRRTAALTAHDERLVTVAQADWSAEATIEPLVVAAAAQRLAGRVVDGDGAAVGGAFLSLRLPDDFHTRFPIPLDRSERGNWHAEAGPDGTFRLPRLPAIEGAALLVAGAEFAPTTVPLPPHDDDRMEIVLQRFHFDGGELRGRVVDATGVNVPGARVVMGVTSVVSDREGMFAISLRRAGWPTAIVAAKAGHLPGRCELPNQGGTKPGDWPLEIVLRLGPPPGSVRGRVVDQERRPIAGAEVWIADPTPLGVAGTLPLQVEYLIGGGAVPRGGMQVPPHADDPTRGSDIAVQMRHEREPSACWQFVTTDADGTFTLPGLLDRSYTLKALDPTSGQFGSGTGAAGDAQPEIVIDRSHLWSELRGRVVSMQGTPVAGVTIAQNVHAFRVEARVPGGRVAGTILRAGRTATSAADGSFLMRDVANRDCTFDVAGDAIVPTGVAVATIADPRDCTIRVEARCHVEILLANPAEADSVACFDTDGKPVDIAVLRRDSTLVTNQLALHGGRSGQFVVGERAARLVLQRDDRPVRSIAIQPSPTRITTVQ